jgi:hypothetical protein
VRASPRRGGARELDRLLRRQRLRSDRGGPRLGPVRRPRGEARASPREHVPVDRSLAHRPRPAGGRGAAAPRADRLGASGRAADPGGGRAGAPRRPRPGGGLGRGPPGRRGVGDDPRESQAQPGRRPGARGERRADPTGQGRLCGGPQVARPWGEPTDLAFIELAHELHANGAEFAIATHDAVLREALLRCLPGLGVEMLLGVRRADAPALAARGVPVRIYVPYGDGWFRYAMVAGPSRWADRANRQKRPARHQGGLAGTATPTRSRSSQRASSFPAPPVPSSRQRWDPYRRPQGTAATPR